MLAPIEYEPFLVMTTSHDAQWSMQTYRRGPKWYAPFMHPAGEMVGSCRHYAQAIRKLYKDFCKANGKHQGERLRRFYYDPLIYLALGHADILSLVLMDDFDPVDAIAANMTRTLENVSIGFAPKLQSLGVDSKQRAVRGLHALWNLKNRKKTSEFPPFMVFSKLKMEGLASVGLGLEFQIALWRTMVKRISKVMDALERQAYEAAGSEESDWINPQDVANTWCSLVDLQGCEEIGLLAFSSNLSAAFSIVGGVRTLTCGDVFDEVPDLLESLRLSKVHRWFSRHAGAGGPSNKNDVARLGDGHVFRWSHSSVNVLPEQFYEPRTGRLFPHPRRLRGYVSARSRFQIPPGHVARSRRLLEPFRTTPPREESGPTRWPDNFFPYLAGLYDIDLDHYEMGLSQAGESVVRTSLVIDNVEETLKRLCLSNEIQQRRGRDVVDFETDLIVPVPKLKDVETKRDLIYCDVGKGHFAPLGKILPRMVEALCRSSKTKLGATPPVLGPPGMMDIPELMKAQRRLGVPASLRRALEYCYQDFAIITADPFYFDVMLDLYDTFSTLHAVLVCHLPQKKLGMCEGTGSQGRALLDETKVRHLSEVVDALHNAVLHRTTNAFREGNWREMAIDFRGGINQILLAADAPVKCGLGILRRFAFHGTEKHASKNVKSRNSVGCVMRVGTMPGARCYKARFGVEDSARLAFFDVDVPHVLHVASYADYLHEAFHLVFEQALVEDKDFAEVLNSADQQIRDRLEEIFAQTLCAMFIFEDDRDTFVYHSVLSYSRDIASAGANDKETCRRFVEVLFRLFLVFDSMMALTVDALHSLRGTHSNGLNDIPSEQMIRKKGRAFDRFVKNAGPFFSEFNRLWDPEASNVVWEYTRSYFRTTYPQIARYLPTVWQKATSIYGLAARTTFPGKTDASVASAHQLIQSEIKVALRLGRPLIWSRYQGTAAVRGQKKEPATAWNFEGGGLDPLPFVCKILHQYIGTLRKATHHNIHLLRTSGSATVSYKGARSWWNFQSDKGAAAMFCCVPKARRERLLKQIVIIKSFWDVSSELRARRLLDMLISSRAH